MSIILSKVRQPQRRSRVLKRIRILDRLHQNLHRRLNFVSAPAGYGKTTLLVDFANDVDAVVCWFHIGSGETDLITFIEYLIAAFQQHYPNFGENLQELIGEGAGAPSPAFWATELVNEIHENIDDFTILVLDDYHVIDSVDQIVEFIEAVLEYLPDQLRILIGSRSFYGIPTATLYVREDIATIGAEDLRFRPDEFRALMSQHYQIKMNKEQAEDLVSRSEGWIVALLLVVRGLKPGVTLPQFKGATEHVFTFLAEEVLNTLPKDLIEFMLVTSIFDEFDVDMCNHVLAIKNSADLIRDIDGRNLFLTRIETREGTAYRYHQLFAEFLRNQFGHSQNERFSNLHHRAANWYFLKEKWALAIQHMLVAGDIEKAAEWMDSKAVFFFANGQQKLLARWLDALGGPKKAARLAPVLTLYNAKSLTFSGDLEESIKLLDMVEKRFIEWQAYEMVANTYVTKGWIGYHHNRDKTALQLVQKAQEVIDSSNVDRYQWYQAERLKGMVLNRIGQPIRALEHMQNAAGEFKRLMEGGDQTENSMYAHDYVWSLLDLGHLNIINGRIFEAEKAYSEAMELTLKHRGNKGRISTAGNELAFLYHQLGNDREAWRIYELALEAAYEVNWPRGLALLLCGRGDFLRDIDEVGLAEESFQEAIKLVQGTELVWLLKDIYLGYALLEMVNSNFSKAQFYIREAARVSDDTLAKPVFQIPMGWVYLTMGQYELAAQELEHSLRALSSLETLTQEIVLVNFLLSCTEYQRKNLDLASRYLQAALRGAAKIGYDDFLVVAGRRLPAMVDFICQYGLNPQLESLCQRIKNFKVGLAEYTSIEDDRETPTDFRLVVRGFGPGRVWRGGELIPNSAWRSSRARALFFYILDNKKVRKEEIGLEFWPEFTSAKVSSNFHTTLWRVRKAFGDIEVVTYDGEYYAINPDISVWYDVFEFENLIKSAKVNQPASENLSNLWQTARDLYEGEFLEDLHYDWLSGRSIELRERVIFVLRNMAHAEFEARNHLASKQNCLDSLRIEPYQDDIHLLLMKNYQALGSTTEAKSHFHGYRKQLEKELNVEPSQDLFVFYHSL